ncbi:MAG: hypothetical protein ACR2GH_18380 [Pseudonocardia sp.]
MALGSGGQRTDAVVNLTASDESRIVFVIEARRSVVIRDLPAVVSGVEAVIGPLLGGRSICEKS